MKTIARFVAFSVVAAVSIVPAAAAQVCLPTYFIAGTKVVDTKTIDFRMKDRTVYRNLLSTACSGLEFDGFVYMTNADEICDMQSIRILRTHQICVLGAFAKLPHVQSVGSSSPVP